MANAPLHNLAKTIIIHIRLTGSGMCRNGLIDESNTYLYESYIHRNAFFTQKSPLILVLRIIRFKARYGFMPAYRQMSGVPATIKPRVQVETGLFKGYGKAPLNR